jgi:hypothetical protein
MKRTFLALSLLALTTSVGSAAVVICTVASGTVLTSTLGGGGYVIDQGTGNNSAPGSGTITCPSVTAIGGGNVISSYGVFATIDYAGGPFGTTSGTTISQVLTLVGGPLGGASILGMVSGGNSSNNVVPPVPFQIGTTLSGATSYAGFTVNVSSTLTAGGPVGAATGQVRLQFEESSAVPEPSTYALISAGLVGIGLARRRRLTGK